MCLRDTHLLESDISSIRQIWLECYLNGCKINSRGIITNINNNVEYDILDTFKDEDGNIRQLNYVGKIHSLIY